MNKGAEGASVESANLSGKRTELFKKKILASIFIRVLRMILFTMWTKEQLYSRAAFWFHRKLRSVKQKSFSEGRALRQSGKQSDAYAFCRTQENPAKQNSLFWKKRILGPGFWLLSKIFTVKKENEKSWRKTIWTVSKAHCY